MSFCIHFSYFEDGMLIVTSTILVKFLFYFPMHELLVSLFLFLQLLALRLHLVLLRGVLSAGRKLSRGRVRFATAAPFNRHRSFRYMNPNRRPIHHQSNLTGPCLCVQAFASSFRLDWRACCGSGVLWRRRPLREFQE